MRYLLIIFFAAVFTSSFSPYRIVLNDDTRSEIDGAWRSMAYDSVGNQLSIVSIVADGYISISTYSVDRREFIGTHGGTYDYNGKKAIYKTEFNSMNPELVGTTEEVKIERQGDQLFINEGVVPWSRIDDGSPGDLHGAWFITGRKRNGELSYRKPGARRTMKILSGTRFQWIAFNDETKQFMGTGGGTYTTEDGRYTENIEFFSRDSSRVGASLGFDYKLEEGDWHHSGLSSKGKPIYEIWSLPSKAFAED